MEQQKKKMQLQIGEGTKRLLLLLVFFVLVFVIIIWGHKRLNHAEVRKLDTAKGMKTIQTLEKKDVTKVDDKVQKLEEKEAKANKKKTEKQDSQTVTKQFKNCLILGDSISEGLYEFDIMDKSLVIAEKGVHLNELDSMLKTAENQNPKKIFLALGMNDLESTYGQKDVFKKHYKAALDELKSKLPKCEIYVNSILPIQDVAIAKVKYDGQWEAFDKTLEELCKEEKVTYIDNNSLVKDEFYAKDGIHMNPAYYPLWVNHMAEVAKL